MRLPSFIKRLAFIGLLVLIPMSALSALAATNNVPVTGLGFYSEPFVPDPNKLKPVECAPLNLTVLYVGGGTQGNNTYLFLGSNGDDDIAGSPKDDCIVGGAGNDKTLDGRNGDDIILGGAGDDTIDGGPGNDTIYGGDNNDTIDGGPGNDTCYGGQGTDTFINCETIINP